MRQPGEHGGKVTDHVSSASCVMQSELVQQPLPEEESSGHLRSFIRILQLKKGNQNTLKQNDGGWHFFGAQVSAPWLSSWDPLWSPGAGLSCPTSPPGPGGAGGAASAL